MTREELDQLVETSTNANSLYAILGRQAASGKLAWLDDFYDQAIAPQEKLYLYIAKQTAPPVCPNCPSTPKFLGYTRGYRTACSSSCARKYAHKVKGAEIRAKAANTLMARYGVDSQLKLPSALAAQKAVMSQRRGILLSVEHKAKIKATLYEKHGVTNPGQSPTVRDKVTKTMTARYGGYFLGINGPKLKKQAWWSKKLEMLETEHKLELLEEFVSTKKFIQARCKTCSTEFSLNISNGSISQCPKCYFLPANRSNKEKQLSEFIESLGFVTLTNAKSKELIWPLSLDIYLPEKSLAIEFNGDYWHDSSKIGPDYHLTKLLACEAKGIKLIQIFEHEYDNKRAVVEARLRSLLGLYADKLHARKCKLITVDAATARAFLEHNHVQGAVSSKLRLGLEYEGKLAMLLTAGVPRFNKKATLEILRICSARDTLIIGGASRLFAWLRQLQPRQAIISYHDRRWGDSKLYETLGFTKQAPSPPSYIYVKGGHKLSRYQAQKHLLPKLLGVKFDPSLSESQNMTLARYNKLYDCGQAVFIHGK